MAFLTLQFLFAIMLLSSVSSLPDGSPVFYSNPGGEFNTRVLCHFVLECSDITNYPFWSFLGVATAITDTDNRFSNISTYVNLQNNTVYVTSLIFSPALKGHETIYICNKPDSTAAFEFDVAKDIISITPVMQNIDISNNTIGDTVMADILIETCLVDVTVSIYKGKQRVYNAVITGNHQSSFTVRYSFNVVESSVGEYGVRVIGDQSTTPLTFFDVTGTPLL